MSLPWLWHLSGIKLFHWTISYIHTCILKSKKLKQFVNKVAKHVLAMTAITTYETHTHMHEEKDSEKSIIMRVLFFPHNLHPLSEMTS